MRTGTTYERKRPHSDCWTMMTKAGRERPFGPLEMSCRDKSGTGVESGRESNSRDCPAIIGTVGNSAPRIHVLPNIPLEPSIHCCYICMGVWCNPYIGLVGNYSDLLPHQPTSRCSMVLHVSLWKKNPLLIGMAHFFPESRQVLTHYYDSYEADEIELLSAHVNTFLDLLHHVESA